MAEVDSSDSEPEETPEASHSEEEPETDNPSEARGKPISEYEEQRLSRIAQNKARMEALGLRKLASSFMSSSPKASKEKGKGKARKKDEDEDYRPIDDEEDDGDDMDVGDDGSDDDEENFVGSRSRKRTVKNKGAKPKKKVSVQKLLSRSDRIDEDDELMQAIALSLQDSAKGAGAVHIKEKKEDNPPQDDIGKRKKKKSFASRVQMTEDELVIHFFQFDETGKGSITVRDLERMAIAHDFTWSDKELADMIHCFDSDGDGKLTLDDFQKIVGRCNMIRKSEDS